MREKRDYQSCFSVKTNGIITDVVVVGGSQRNTGKVTTEILNVKSQTWSGGPSLPITTFNFATVESMGDQYLGFLIGGYKYDRIVPVKNYYVFQGVKTIDDSLFGLQKMDGTLKWVRIRSIETPRYWHTVVNAPFSVVPSC